MGVQSFSKNGGAKLPLSPDLSSEIAPGKSLLDRVSPYRFLDFGKANGLFFLAEGVQCSTFSLDKDIINIRKRSYDGSKSPELTRRPITENQGEPDSMKPNEGESKA